MKTYLDCIPCFMGQALRAGRIATKDEKKIKDLLNVIGGLIKDIPMENTPPETARIIYQKISEITGVNDPYKNIKKENIKEALSLYPELKEIIKKSKNKLLTAIRIAIAGNVIDFGALNDFNIVENVKTILNQDFAIIDFEKFKNELKNTESILYLGDNAGESVFDKILIEELNKPVTYAVREIPTINDVTIDDAVASGLNEVAQIISSGSTAPATILSLCNENFLNKFNNADLIISKGQGNYEALSNVKQNRIFFMLMAKCSVIANDLQVKNGDIVLKAIN
ncbi:ARMT1-like domain-containing protein [Desulfobacula sp.]|uniref:damage-control phosphatase ARMT1 family protein n=1 Tax=Desulfobacula sp. TaxID=2593537 RepID=UPI0025C42FC3|nr:ARMT1-like domain-containing protein [Desulfobacula sp.]